MEVISRGKCDQGLTWMPRLRRSWLMVVLSTMRNSRPNLSRISSCHCTCRDEGQTISTERTLWRRISSWTTRPASMVLPRPTSSAISRFTRGMESARTTGSSWYSSTSMPLRKGDWRALSSAWDTAPQRTASRKACRRLGWSKESGSGSVDFSRTVVPGSTSQMI